ncbi:MAG: hypothetical protein CMN56_04485 [Sneathiella sp.]|uniref:energy transducer TonB n=1 Tax=Sneathiella sp. TaxID=1964365 RepID=UPI000C4FCB6D|nr:energy transducer TonB [Sneathiella sp.]MAZ02374.1 hypothetical protein [Sneathiella sp.]
MVAATAVAFSEDQGKRWLVYLTLSVCANVFLMSLVQLNARPDMVFEIPVMEVNLMTVSRPTPTAPPQEVVKAVQPPPPPPREVARVAPVETTPYAARKIAAVPEITPSRVQPVEKTPAKPVPLPKAKPPEAEITEVAAKPVKEIVAKPTPKAVKPPEQRPVPEAVKKPVVKPVSEPAKKLVAVEPPVGQNVGEDDSTVIHQARYRHQVAPVYPRRAQDLGQQGTVTLHAEVLPSGDPRELKIAKSSGHRLLDMAALAAVKKWKFEPTSVNGSAIVSWVRVPVNFVIH